MTDKNMNMQELMETYLNDDAVSEFDTMISRYRRRKTVRGFLAAAASLVVLVSVIHVSSRSDKADPVPRINTVELLETINTLADTGMDEISSITARPEKDRIIVTAEFTNGLTKTYLMKRGPDGSSIELTAQVINH